MLRRLNVEQYYSQILNTFGPNSKAVSAIEQCGQSSHHSCLLFIYDLEIRPELSSSGIVKFSELFLVDHG